MKRFFGSNYFLHLFTYLASQHVPVTALPLYKCKLVLSVLLRVDIGSIYGPIAQDLKFD